MHDANEGKLMVEPVTAKEILSHLSPYDLSRLSPYDLDRVTFQMADGLPVVAVYVDTDENGGAVITLSDQTAEDEDEEG